MGRNWARGRVHRCGGGGGGAVSVFGDFGLVVGGGGGRGGALSVLGGLIAQSTCKCVVRKLVVYLVH